ncbi:MAG: biotin--[acetyl-CoA-carboxylase] ligase [Flavobacteriaceae bacterium]|nr:biotin--[acetyl-CoA-carboxylase] ligase [Flavobacteriaceae bacterium]|tara:strand:- start:4809 stop:5546 length:738 start_codon:yes stop_codon:yes gene_type:complete
MFNFNIIKLDAISSTNDWLKEKYDKNSCVDGDLIWVNEQTMGRGQKSNKWLSEAGKNLTFSFFKVLKSLKVNDQFIINCSVSTAIIDALKKIHVPNLSLKWPNDILSDDKKICGILIENYIKGDAIVGSIIGIGLNINQTDFTNIKSASSVLNQTGKEFDLEFVLNLLLNSFMESFKFCKSESKEYLIRKYEKLLFAKNRLSKFEVNDQTFNATIIGIDLDGKLVLQNEKKEILLFSNSAIKMIY